MERAEDLGRDGRHYRKFVEKDGMSVAHPAPDFSKDAGLMRLIDHLGGGDIVRIVGGAVRDALAGLTVADIDLATVLTPDEVTDILQAAEIKVFPTGVEHGTVTAVVDGRNFEITTLRRDVATDGRRAVVAFSKDWQEDAARRDFTINALYADAARGEIFDYFDGVRDLANKCLRFIGDPVERIAEDHLRILRYFRFLGRYGTGRMDQVSLDACSSSAKRLMAISRERIASELGKILVQDNPRSTIALMQLKGIFESFMPEICRDAGRRLEQLYAHEITINATPSLARRIVAILPDEAGLVEKVALRLKLSNAMRKALAERVNAAPPTPANIRAIAYGTNIDAAFDIAMLKAADFPGCVEQLSGWHVPAFPIGGGQLVKMGLEQGPLVAMTLQAVEAAWIAAGFDNTRLPALIDQLVGAAKAVRKN
jgi:poly(A) polymerase